MRIGHAAILCLGVSIPSLASGQSNTYSAILDTSIGYSDNVNLAEENPAPGEVGAVADGFATIAPQLLVQRDSRRSVHRLGYSFNAQIFFENPEANSYTNQLEWQSQFLLSRRARLGLDASIAQGETSNFQLVSPGPVQATQAGGVSFVSVTAGQNWSFEQNRNWRYEETLNLQSFLPTDGQTTDSGNLDFTFQAQRSWERTSLAILWLSNYLFVFGDGGQHSVVGGPSLLFRRDFLESWSFELGAGAVAVFSPDNFEASGVTVEPVGQAAVRFRRQRSQLEFGYSHDVVPNVQVGETFINDTLSLDANYVLFERPTIFVQGSLGAQSAREISTIDTNIGASSFIYFADAALGWAVNGNIELSARYQYRQQDADVNSNLQSFVAHTGLITLSGRYPGNNTQRRSNLRRSFRVDGTDAEDAFGTTDRREAIRRPATSR